MRGGEPVIYCFDTSSLLQAWVRGFPIDIMPSFWDEFEKLLGDTVIAPREVCVELEKKEDDLYEWAKGRDGFFVDLDHEQQLATRAIMSAHPRLVDTRKGRSQADPFVIALAQVSAATVVTEENLQVQPGKSPKIPNVSRALGIRCIRLLDFIREQGWRW